jgi:hypothetical protein
MQFAMFVLALITFIMAITTSNPHLKTQGNMVGYSFLIIGWILFFINYKKGY